MKGKKSSRRVFSRESKLAADGRRWQVKPVLPLPKNMTRVGRLDGGVEIFAKPVALVAQEWYADKESGARFKILALGDETLAVVDEHGLKRTVNRLLFERDMRPAQKVKRTPV